MQTAFFYIFSNKKYHRVNLDEIGYLISLGRHLKVKTESKVYLPKISLSEMEKLLPTVRFVKINRTTMIAIEKIENFDHRAVTVVVGREKVDLEITHTFRKQFFEKLSVKGRTCPFPERLTMEE